MDFVGHSGSTEDAGGSREQEEGVSGLCRSLGEYRGCWGSREQEKGMSGLHRILAEHRGGAPTTGEVTGREARRLWC